MPDLPDSPPIAATTDDCFSHDNLFVIFSNLDTDSRSLGPSSPAVSTDQEILVLSTPNSPVTYVPNPDSTDKQANLDSTSTIEATDNDLTNEAPPTADIHLVEENSNEDQHELPPAYPLPTDSSPVLSRANQFKHRAETANVVKSRKQRREYFASKPKAIIRPRINSRPRYGLKPEFESGETIFWDDQRKQLPVQKTFLPSQQLVVFQQAVTAFPHQDTWQTGATKDSCNIAFCTSIPYFFSFPRTPQSIFSSFQRGELSRYSERSNLRKEAIF